MEGVQRQGEGVFWPAQAPGGPGGGGSDGGGPGGGNFPWRGGHGPMGHKYEDPRREGRVQKYRGRGRGNGHGRGGRGGREGKGRGVGRGSSNKYKNQNVGPREVPEGVNYGSTLKDAGLPRAPSIADGIGAAEAPERNRPINRRAGRIEFKDGAYVGTNLLFHEVEDFVTLVTGSFPSGPGWRTQITRADDEADSFVSSQAFKNRFPASSIRDNDPFGIGKPRGQTSTRTVNETKAKVGDQNHDRSEVVKNRFAAESLMSGDPFGLDEEEMEMEGQDQAPSNRSAEEQSAGELLQEDGEENCDEEAQTGNKPFRRGPRFQEDK